MRRHRHRLVLVEQGRVERPILRHRHKVRLVDEALAAVLAMNLGGVASTPSQRAAFGLRAARDMCYAAVATMPVPIFVLLCRDCCCGTRRKHPDVDHDAQEAVLREAALASGGKLVRTRCLGVCERSNVVVVKTGRHTLWFGDTLSPERTGRIARLVREGPTDLTHPHDDAFNVVARRSRCLDR
jgi:(2Fe-2S) ferredoxin